MLERTNYIFFVGDGKNQEYNEKSLIIWNIEKNQVARGIGFVSAIKNIKMNSKRLIVILEEKIYQYNLKNFEKIGNVILTLKNP